MKADSKYKAEVANKYKNIVCIEGYKGDSKGIMHQCTTCGFKWKIIPTNALHREEKCPSCKVTNMKKKHVEECNKRHPNITFSDFNFGSDKVDAECSICGNEWNSTFNLVKFYGCRKCQTLENHRDRKEDGSFGIFYKALFTHKKEGYQFLKIGITSDSVQNRYRNGGYTHFDFEILSEEKTTLKQAKLKELEYKQANLHNRFYFPDDIKFDGHTECYMVDDYVYTTSKSLITIRNSIIEKQNGLCVLCTNPLISPVCDHHHTGAHKGDGAIRGVVCSVCNSILGKFENAFIRYGLGIDEMPNFISNLAVYTSEDSPYKTKYIYPSEKPKEPKLMKSSYNELLRVLKKQGHKKKVPPYPKLKKMTKALQELYDAYDVAPKFYEKAKRGQ